MKRTIFWIATSILSVILVFFGAELLLRLCGFQPWSYYPDDINEPTFHEFDPVLGWKLKSGRYIYPAYKTSEDNIQVTILPGGRRDTGAEKRAVDADEVLVVGGSFTFGLAISDNETYPWKLQTMFPSFNIMNYGTAGYGGYQSLLVMERELPRLKSPAFVIYGFFQHHEERNVAPSEWLEMLSRYSYRKTFICPMQQLTTTVCFPDTNLNVTLKYLAWNHCQRSHFWLKYI